MTNTPSCCTPSRAFTSKTNNDPGPQRGDAAKPLRDSVPVPGGLGFIGTNSPIFSGDGEAPLRQKKLSDFHCERGTVTNQAFARFIKATGYVTDAERIGWSFVFIHLVPPELTDTQAVAGLTWWRRVVGACWHSPSGPLGPKPPADHPVVQVSWSDARAYARWARARLPTEAEWEHAARGGLGDVLFPWGDARPDDIGFTPCNIWQGRFPQHNTCRDGFMATAPAISFAPNGYGLYNMVGNVWEWTSEPFKVRSLKRQARKTNTNADGLKLTKGGSFLCHASYCFRYRIAARSNSTADTATSHIGFRVVYDHSDTSGQYPMIPSQAL